MQKNEVKDLTVGSPMKLILSFAIPMLFGFLIHQRQMLWQNLHLLPTGNAFSNFRIQLIQSITATHLHVIMPVPFEAWNKEQRQYRIGHEYLIPPVFSAYSADYSLCEIKLLSSVCNSHHKKHNVTLSFLVMM